MKKIMIKEEDLNKIAFATLQKVFSYTLKPRIILAGEKTNLLSKYMCSYAFIQEINQIPGNFSQTVKNCYFDIGISLEKKDDFICVNIFSGSGLKTCNKTLSIYEKWLNYSEKELNIAKKNLTTLYSKITGKTFAFEKAYDII